MNSTYSITLLHSYQMVTMFIDALVESIYWQHSLGVELLEISPSFVSTYFKKSAGRLFYHHQILGVFLGISWATKQTSCKSLLLIKPLLQFMEQHRAKVPVQQFVLLSPLRHVQILFPYMTNTLN